MEPTINISNVKEAEHSGNTVGIIILTKIWLSTKYEWLINNIAFIIMF